LDTRPLAPLLAVCHDRAVRLGAYEVGARIGQGGMGVVHAARASDGRALAIKLLTGTDAQSFGRFDRERRLLALLGEGEGFVPLLDAGLDASGPYLVMPYLGGGTLRDRLARGPLPIPEVVALGRSLAAALGRAHERGVVHRDVKPANVLYTDGGVPLLGDLGLAKHFRRDVAGGSQSRSVSVHSELSGTIGYMAPEQVDGAAVGPEADVFAVGVVLYECLAGKRPFAGEGILEYVANLRKGDAPPLARARPETPAWLAHAIARACAFDRASRPRDGGELLRALEPGALPGRGRRGAIAAAAIAVALAVVVAVASRRLVAPPPPGARTRPVAPPSLPPLTATFASTTLADLTWVHGSHALRANSPVAGAVFSPDGRRLLSGCDRGTVTLWDATTGEEIRALDGHTAKASAVFTPDGKRAVSASQDGRAIVWDLATGQPLRTLAAGTGPLGAVAISRDGARALTGGSGTILLWDLETGVVLASLEGHAGAVYSVDLSPDGSQAVSGGADGTVRLWDLASARERIRRDEHAALTLVRFLAGGERIVCGTAAGRVAVWDAVSGADFSLGETHANVFAVSSSGERLLTGVADFVLRDLALAELRLFAGHTSYLHSLAFSPDGKRALSGSLDQTLRLWDVATGVRIRPPGSEVGHEGRVLGMAAAADGRTVLSAGVDRSVRLVDAASGRELASFLFSQSMEGCAFCAGGRRAVAVDAAGGLHVLDLEARREVASYGGSPEGLTSAVARVAVSPDGKWALASQGSALALVDLETGTHRLDTKMGNVVSALAFEADGEGAVVATTDHRTGVIRFAGSAARPAVEARSTATAVVALPDGRHVATIDDAGLDVFELDEGRSTLLPGPKTLALGSAGLALAVSWDGRTAVVACRGGRIEIVDLGKLERLGEIDLRASSDLPTALAFAPDGRSFYCGTARGVTLGFELVR
jgi:WD40 repeat protein